MSAPRCLVLGGSGYVGRAVCRLLVERGARLAFTYCNNEQRMPGARGYRLDARDYAEVRRVVSDAAALWDGLDALIQCIGTAGDANLYERAAQGSGDKFLDIDETAWDEMLAVTAKSTFVACQAAVPVMSRQGGGNIAIVGSIDGVKSVPAPVHYAAAKGALTAMTRALAKQLGRYAIRVNQVAVGVLDGGLSAPLNPALKDEYLKYCCLQRFGVADEVAQSVVWFAVENTYITGQTMALDGGL